MLNYPSQANEEAKNNEIATGYTGVGVHARPKHMVNAHFILSPIKGLGGRKVQESPHIDVKNSISYLDVPSTAYMQVEGCISYVLDILH